MRPIISIVPDGVDASPLPVRKLETCPCGTRFLRNATSETGSYAEAVAHPQAVVWTPTKCVRCEREALLAETRYQDPRPYPATKPSR